MNITERIRELMDERGWTEYRLIRHANLPASTISNIFHRNTVPGIATLECICHAFGITLSQFFSHGQVVSLTEEQSVLLDQWAILSNKQKQILLDLMAKLH